MPPLRPRHIRALLLCASEADRLQTGSEDYDVIGKDGEVVGRIMKTGDWRAGMPWMWSLATRREDEVPVLGYEQPAKPPCRHSLGSGIRNDRGVSPEVRSPLEDHYDVIADGVVVGRIMMFTTTPAGQPWVWTIALGHEEERTRHMAL